MLAFLEWAGEQAKLTISEAARLVGVCCRTALHWLSRRREDGLEARPLGRTPEQGSVEERNKVISFLSQQGPQVGLPTLQAQFRKRARRELQELQQRYRQVYQQKKRLNAQQLSWRVGGTVWAMDFTKLPCLVDSEFTHALVVRDLASHQILEALPVRNEDAITCCGVLAALFEMHGAPLALKEDNGSAFIAEATRDLLERWEVAVLYSPPRTPEYNGACEAGMGGIKTRAHYHAARNGRPGAWTCDDLEAGRRQANELGRPRGANAPTPSEAWEARPPITELQRELFLTTWRRHQVEARSKLGLEPDQVLIRAEQACVDRQAIPRALEEHGLLSIERRWVSLRKKR